MIKVAHLLDDTQVGGVVQHLELFKDDRLLDIAQSTVIPVATSKPGGRLDADIIVLHLTMSWRKLPFLLGLRLSHPDAFIILEEHSYTEGFERHCVRSPGRFRLMLRLAYRLIDRVVAVSEAQGAWMTRAGLLPARKLSIIPMARETESFENLSSPRTGSPIRLGILGRFAPQKGIDHAIRAVQGLSGVELVIGGYGPMEDKLRALAGGAPNIAFAGKVEDPRGFIEDIDALLMTSRYEAFGLTGLEARAAGRPLIAYAVDGLADQLAAGGGIAVPADDEAGLRRVLDKLTARDIGRLVPAARRGARHGYDDQVEAWRKLFGASR